MNKAEKYLLEEKLEEIQEILRNDSAKGNPSCLESDNKIEHLKSIVRSL